MLEFEQVSFSYEVCSALVLQDLSLKIGNDEFVSIVGLSGCGKTTLLHLAAGFYLPTVGRILFDGKEVVSPSPDRVMVFQEDAVFPWYTVMDNVKYPLLIKRVEEEEIEKQAAAYLKLVGLENFSDFFPKELSGGMKKRVDLARAYLAGPKLLLMDEPFGALDTHTRQKMQMLLMDLWQRDRKTVLFVTHDIAEAVFLSDRVIVMSSCPGKIYKIYTIRTERPRKLEMKHNPEFVRLVSVLEKDIWTMEENTNERPEISI